MRVELFIIGLCVFATGCNADPRYRREIALIKAELLDVEEKLSLTKAQRDDALAALESGGNSAVAKKIGRRNAATRRTMSNEIYPGEVIYSDEIYDEGVIFDAPGYPTTGQPDLNSPPFDYAPHGFAPAESPTANPRMAVPPNTNESIPIDLDGPEVIAPLESEGLESEGVVPSAAPPSAVPTSESSAVPANPASSILLTGPSSNTTNPRAASSSTLTEIVIDRNQTRGHDIDGQPGDDGLNVLLRPRSASGETLLQSGGLTVSVIDPSAPTAAQRIGLWKFLPAEAELFFSNESPETRGILLHLPWEKTVPSGKEVVVFVRFQTSDGRRLETTANIRITPRSPSATDESPAVENNSDLIAGWINRDDQRQSGNKNSSGSRPIAQRPNNIQATPVSNAAQPSWRPVR